MYLLNNTSHAYNVNSYLLLVASYVTLFCCVSFVINTDVFLMICKYYICCVYFHFIDGIIYCKNS